MKPWVRPLPYVVVASFVLARASHAEVDDAAGSREEALCKALPATHGIGCVPEDVAWIDPVTGVRRALGTAKVRALVRAKNLVPTSGEDPSEAHDVWLVSARLSPEGQLLDVGDGHPMARSSGADESRPVVRGHRAAYVVTIDGRPQAVHVLDLDGHDAEEKEDLSRGQRLQVAIADWQATGQTQGVKRTVVALTPAPAQASVRFDDAGMLVVDTESEEGKRSLVVDVERGAAVADASSYVRVTPETVSPPPTFAPWMSDRLRAVSFIGDEKNQILKTVVFGALEWVKNTKSQMTGDTGEKSVEEDLGSVVAAQDPVAFSDPEIGWPPKALDPVFKPAIPGEGRWITLDKDPFITPIPGLHAPFATTFVRSDPEAKQTRVYITAWDPRLVALHMEAGTVEPVSATGEAGPGIVPRAPEVLKHVVAGFNGGFQATHGEFGMQANGVLYLPPKPYGATVLEMKDGTTGFGAWPKSAEVPGEVLSFRQNMTALVQDGKYNPWGRAWWGGVPPGWHDRTHTTRSGLCITEEGFVAYLWGNDIGPEPLGRAMLAARCSFGMHLDMNPGLAGFELYNVQPASTFEPLGRPLQTDWEFEGPLKDAPEFKYRARRMVRGMGHILFPRYLHRDGRDFFYLTTRNVLPGHPLPTPSAQGAAVDPTELVFRTKGLPQHGFPYATAIARTVLPTGAAVRVVRVDPRTVSTEAAAATGADAGGPATVLVLAKPPKGGKAADGDLSGSKRALTLGGGVFALEGQPATGRARLVDVVESGAAHAAVGIADEDGMLQILELAPDAAPSEASSKAMLEMLASLGCSARGLLAADVRAYLGGTLDAAGAPAATGAVVTQLYRAAAPSAARVFQDVPVVPQSVWYPLQQQKVKWRPTLAPKEKPADAGAPPPPTGTGTAPAGTGAPPGPGPR